MQNDWMIRIGRVIALAVLSLGALSAWQGLSLQAELDRLASLRQAESALRAALIRGGRTAVESALRRMVSNRALGFRELSWRSSGRRDPLTVQRGDHLRLPLLRADWSRAVSRRVLALGADSGEVAITVDGHSRGRLGYLHVDPLAIEIHDRALRQLRWLGVAATILGLLLLVLLPAAARSASRHQQQLQHRLQREQPPPRTAPIVDGEMPGHERGGMRNSLAQLQRGLILIDGERRVRYMNAAAEGLCGWPLGEARGRLIYSVFHPLDEQEQPLPTPGERVLETDAPITGEEIWLRARDASVRPIEVDAACGGSGTDRYAVMLFRDISTRRILQRESEQAVLRSQQLLDSLREGVIVTDADGIVRSVNAEVQRLFGYPARELIGEHAKRVMPVPFMNSPGVRFLDYLGSAPSARRPRVVGWRKDGATFPVELTVHGVGSDPENGLVLLIRDDSARRRGERAMQRIGRILDTGRLEVLVLDAASRQLVEINPAAREQLQYTAAQLRGLSYDRIAESDDPRALDTLFDRLRREPGRPQSVQMTHQRADGSRYALTAKFQFAADEEPPMVLMIGERVVTGPRPVN